MKFPSHGLYAITQTTNQSIAQVITDVESALKGGAVVVQYRDKHPLNARHLATELVSVCHSYQAPLLINDDVALALAVGADGVHLGRDDGDIESARRQLGDEAIIGVSCYNDIARAKTAIAAGADYVAFGRFFPSGSKPLAAPSEVSTLKEAKKQLKVPIVAIGGILPQNGGHLIDAGADLLAVIGGLFDSPTDPYQAAQLFQTLFTHRKQPS